MTAPEPGGAEVEPSPEAETAPEPASDADSEPSSLDDILDADSAEAGDALEEAEAKAAEHLDDLQRLQAEYVNYRKRVERDREAVLDLAVARVIEALIPVLDDIAAARDHGDLDGPFAAIADKLEGTLSKFGCAAYGENGEPFDPAIHEALTSTTEPELASPVVREVVQVGYRLGDRILRPTRVVVAQPE